MSHILGVSSLAAGHLTFMPQLRAALHREGRADVVIAIGGVIPPQDFDALRDAGVAADFPPGTAIPEAAARLIEALNESSATGRERSRNKIRHGSFFAAAIPILHPRHKEQQSRKAELVAAREKDENEAAKPSSRY